MSKPLKIIDLFAGPGGLGEGFSAFRDSSGKPVFKIGISIEKEASAHKTLQLRALYRQFPDGKAPEEYYRFLAGEMGKSPEEGLFKLPQYRKEIQAAKEEALCLTLGKDNRKINLAISEALGKRPGPWVLIGGPPCQAYSLVGRSRNRGIKDYSAEEDHRSYLYKEYLKVISRFQPSIFVMENVKGMLSAKVDDEPLFPRIHGDLKCPARALNRTDDKIEYEIFSFSADSISDDLFGGLDDPRDFIIRAENHGVPQARHRVILLGIRKDIASKYNRQLLGKQIAPTVGDVIRDLPPLRSGLSKDSDSFDSWVSAIRSGSAKIISSVRRIDLMVVAEQMQNTIDELGNYSLQRGSNFSSTKSALKRNLNSELRSWYQDSSGWRGICNHETRGHIVGDLHRYLFCASYGAVAKNGDRWTPKSEEFPDALVPDHSNWHSGHFSDRYRVQVTNRVGSTITSHISKDGHYFIHYDPLQCRSLTVREAARIQTFPDNYFFVGNRTQQYVQVGNAVPPYLAQQIACIVFKILGGK